MPDDNYDRIKAATRKLAALVADPHREYSDWWVKVAQAVEELYAATFPEEDGQ